MNTSLRHLSVNSSKRHLSVNTSTKHLSVNTVFLFLSLSSYTKCFLLSSNRSETFSINVKKQQQKTQIKTKKINQSDFDLYECFSEV